MRRDGKPLEFLGWYNPLNKETNLNAPAIKKWLSGAHPAARSSSSSSSSSSTNGAAAASPASGGAGAARQAAAEAPLGAARAWWRLLTIGPLLPPAPTALLCAVGAQPSDTVASLLKKAMIIEQ